MLWKGIASIGKKKLLSFLFPADCLHCSDPVESDQLLCPSCASLIEWIEPEEKNIVGAALAAEGPAWTLIEARHKLPEAIAKSMAAFLVVALSKREWPYPDVIFAVPTDPFNEQLAKELSLFLDVPVSNALTKRGWKRFSCFSGDIVLLVDALEQPVEEFFSLMEEACVEEKFYLSFGVRR